MNAIAMLALCWRNTIFNWAYLAATLLLLVITTSFYFSKNHKDSSDFATFAVYYSTIVMFFLGVSILPQLVKITNGLRRIQTPNAARVLSLASFIYFFVWLILAFITLSTNNIATIIALAPLIILLIIIYADAFCDQHQQIFSFAIAFNFIRPTNDKNSQTWAWLLIVFVVIMATYSCFIAYRQWKMAAKLVPSNLIITNPAMALQSARMRRQINNAPTFPLPPTFGHNNKAQTWLLWLRYFAIVFRLKNLLSPLLFSLALVATVLVAVHGFSVSPSKLTLPLFFACFIFPIVVLIGLESNLTNAYNYRAEREWIFTVPNLPELGAQSKWLAKYYWFLLLAHLGICFATIFLVSTMYGSLLPVRLIISAFGISLIAAVIIKGSIERSESTAKLTCGNCLPSFLLIIFSCFGFAIIEAKSTTYSSFIAILLIVLSTALIVYDLRISKKTVLALSRQITLRLTN